MYYKVETHDDEHVNDDEDEFIVPSSKVELIPADTSVITTEPIHDEADNLPASVVVPENVEPVVCEVDPQQNDVQGMELDILDMNIKYLHIYLIMIYQVIK